MIFDEVIAAAFREIGDRWECHDAEVYQERRACDIALRILFDLRRVQQVPERKWLATGGTIEGDLYSLPSAMAELVLRDCGFHATSLGTSIPFASLVKAVQETKPKLFWLSVSHICEELDFVSEFAALSQACVAADTALVVGGRALTEDVATPHDLFGVLRHHATPRGVRYNTAPIVGGRRQNTKTDQAAKASSRITEVRCILHLPTRHMVITIVKLSQEAMWNE